MRVPQLKTRPRSGLGSSLLRTLYRIQMRHGTLRACGKMAPRLLMLTRHRLRKTSLTCRVGRELQVPRDQAQTVARQVRRGTRVSSQTRCRSLPSHRESLRLFERARIQVPRMQARILRRRLNRLPDKSTTPYSAQLEAAAAPTMDPL